jgi:TonB family protein
MMRVKHFIFAACLCFVGARVASAQSASPPPPPPTQAHDSDSEKNHPVQRVVKRGNEQMPLATKLVPPHYPDVARQRHIEGTVRLDTIIDTDGKVIDAKYISGPRELVQASIECVKQWRFKPTVVNENAVQVECVFEFNFNLGR